MNQPKDSSALEADSTNSCLDPPAAKRPKLQKFVHPEPLLAAKFNRQELQLEDFYVLVVKEKRELSAILKSVSKDFPADFKHLKRIRVDDDGIAYVLLRKKSAGDFPSEFRGFEVRIMPVPIESPDTRSQFEFGRPYWPVTFREDKRLEALLAR